MNRVREFVRKYPLRVVGVALVLGAIFLAVPLAGVRMLLRAKVAPALPPAS